MFTPNFKHLLSLTSDQVLEHLVSTGEIHKLPARDLKWLILSHPYQELGDLLYPKLTAAKKFQLENYYSESGDDSNITYSVLVRADIALFAYDLADSVYEWAREVVEFLIKPIFWISDGLELFASKVFPTELK